MFSEDIAFVSGYISFIVIAFVQILVFGILTYGMIVLINSFFIKNLNSINVSLLKITKGLLDEKINKFLSLEFNSLSNSINKTVSYLQKLLIQQKEHDKKDIDLAKTIQTSALPNTFPAFPTNFEVDIHSSYKAAKEIGGDYFEYFFISKNKVLFTIGDVSGKGIPAALFMMKTKTAYKIFSSETSSPGAILADINEYLIIDNEAGMFVTCWLGILDIQTGVLTYAVAGHNPPILIRQSDHELTVLDLKTPPPPLGLIGGLSFKDYTYQMEQYEKIILYTDGVTEAHNVKDEFFGTERLEDIIKRNVFKDCTTTDNDIFESLGQFIGRAEQFDDISTLVLRYLGPSYKYFTNGKLYNDILVKAEMKNLKDINAFLKENMDQTSFPGKLYRYLVLIVDEIFSNIVNYAYTNHDGYFMMAIEVDETQEKNSVCLNMIDNAKQFNPLEINDPDLSTDLSSRKAGGLGIFIVKDVADEVSYEYKNGHNCLKIVKFY